MTARDPMSSRDPTTSRDPDRYDEAFWRDFLTHGSPQERTQRRVLRMIPSSPRCRLCAAPFGGLGAPLMRVMGKTQSDENPTMCNACNVFLMRHHGGAEVVGSMLFADIRGSTTIAESVSPAAFHDLINRFYSTASEVVFAHDGMVDKFVGDELVAFFIPLMSGERHAAQAVAAARSLLEATGHRQSGGPWVPVGAGVSTGTVWFGAVGEGSHVELTALGDEVNVAARLASAAAAGEILITSAAAVAAGVPVEGADRRRMALKGKQEATDVLSLRVGGPAPRTP